MASSEVLTYPRGQKLDNNLLRKLNIKLLVVHAMLDDVEAKQFTKSVVKIWLDELKDVVCDVEDLLDEIITEALHYKVEFDAQIGATHVRNTIFASLDQFREGIESKVEEITDKLEYLAQEKYALGLKKGFREKLSQRRPMTSLVDGSGVFERTSDMKEIVDYLLSHDVSGNKIGVMALVGMGGIGRITLTQLVNNDRRVT